MSKLEASVANGDYDKSGDFCIEIRSGYHVYISIWNPVLGEQLATQLEYGNPEDRYAVSVMKSSRNSKRNLLRRGGGSSSEVLEKYLSRDILGQQLHASYLVSVA